MRHLRHARRLLSRRVDARAAAASAAVRTDVAGFVGIAERGPARRAGANRIVAAVRGASSAACSSAAISPTPCAPSSRTAAGAAGWCACRRRRRRRSPSAVLAPTAGAARLARRRRARAGRLGQRPDRLRLDRDPRASDAARSGAPSTRARRRFDRRHSARRARAS